MPRNHRSATGDSICREPRDYNFPIFRPRQTGTSEKSRPIVPVEKQEAIHYICFIVIRMFEMFE